MRKMKLFAILLVAAMLLFTAACGVGETDDPTDPNSPDFDITQVEPEELRIAILLPSSPTDGGWGQVGAEGIQGAAEHFGVEPTIVEAPTADLMTEEAEALAAEGYHIIFGHGGQYASPFAEINQDWPNTLFVTHGGTFVEDNLMPFEFTLEEITYCQGVITGEMADEMGIDAVGLVIGGEFPAYQKTSRGFFLGLESVDPTIEQLFGVTADAADMSEGYELTSSQIDGGADIVWSNANQATQGSITAAREQDTLVWGTVRDAQAEAPDHLIGTAFQNFTPPMIELIEDYMTGDFETEIRLVREPSGGIGMTWNEDVVEELPVDAKAIYEETLQKIHDGEIDVPGEREGWD